MVGFYIIYLLLPLKLNIVYDNAFYKLIMTYSTVSDYKGLMCNI